MTKQRALQPTTKRAPVSGACWLNRIDNSRYPCEVIEVGDVLMRIRFTGQVPEGMA